MLIIIKVNEPNGKSFYKDLFILESYFALFASTMSGVRKAQPIRILCYAVRFCSPQQQSAIFGQTVFAAPLTALLISQLSALNSITK